MSSRHPSERLASGKARKGTFFQVTFPTMPTLERKPYEAQLTQKQGHHDILRLSFSQEGKQWFEDIPTGLPVRFSWIQEGVETTWVGYVSYVSKVVTSLRDRTMEVMCIGSSFPLKDKGMRVFTDTTIPEAVAKLATEFNLEFISDSHPRKFSQLTLAGHSYWAWIQEQASRIGYAAYMDGVTLYFRSFDKVISQNTNSIPVLSIEDKTTVDGQLFYDRTMEYFKVLKGDFVEGEGSVRTDKHVAGVNPVTKEAFIAKASPSNAGTGLRKEVSPTLFNEYRTDQVATSANESEVIAKDAAHLSRFTLPAKVKGRGDYRFKPYALVHVLGTGPTTDGYWLVKEAVHTFGKFGTYDVDLTILSDGTGDTSLTGFSLSTSAGRDLVNISEAISNGGAVTSRRAAGEAKLGHSLTAITHKQLGYKPSSAKWTAR